MITFLTPELVCDSCENGLNHRYIFAENGRVHISYHKRVGGVWQVFYRMKDISWYPEERVTNTSADAKYPSILVFRDSVFLVWHDYRVGGISNIEIFFNAKRIFDISWNLETRLTYTNSGGPGDNGYLPTIKENGGKLFIIWYDYRDDPTSNRAQIYLKVRDSVWGSDVRISNSPANAWYPAFDFRGDTLFVFWADNRNSAYNIYGNWGYGDQRITDVSSGYPDVANSSGKLLLVYTNSSSSPPRISAKIYDGSWGSQFDVRPSGRSQSDPTVVRDGRGGWIVAWSEDFGGDRDIFGVRLNSLGIITDSFRIFMPGNQNRPSLFVDENGYIHLTFVDYTNPFFPKIYYTKSSEPLKLREFSRDKKTNVKPITLKGRKLYLRGYSISGRKLAGNL